MNLTKQSRFLNLSKVLLALVLLFCVALFIIGDLFGQMQNSRCFQYLGCNSGFFGYDALVHFISGMMQATFIVWLARRYVRFNILHDSFWKNVFTIIAFVALIGVSWEIFEFLGDRFRIYFFHMDLLNTGRLFQASNSDTMGDMTLALIGAKIILLTLKTTGIDKLNSRTCNTENLNLI